MTNHIFDIYPLEVQKEMKRICAKVLRKYKKEEIINTQKTKNKEFDKWQK
jgi:hypothetical protein